MYKFYILLVLILLSGSCRKQEIISIEKGVVDHRFIGTWEFINGTNKEKYTFFNNNKIEYSTENNFWILDFFLLERKMWLLVRMEDMLVIILMNGNSE